jgi:hypothetical protein
MVTVVIFGQYCNEYKWASLFWNVYGAVVILINVSLIFTFDKWYNAIGRAWFELIEIMRE